MNLGQDRGPDWGKDADVGGYTMTLSWRMGSSPIYKPFSWPCKEGGPTTRSLGDNNNHHGYFHHVYKWNDPPSIPSDVQY